jgi:antitoxin (DNA-binding transcriptional repressor) of toxin-antitoxin stability system
MKIANVRDVRNRFSALEAWVGEGEKIEIRKRGKPIAWLVPIPQSSRIKPVKPDFAARRKAIWGHRVFTTAQVKEMRDAEREGEEG